MHVLYDPKSSPLPSAWSGRLASAATALEVKRLTTLRVRVDGPYSFRSLTATARAFSSIVLIGGGVGITPLMSLFDTLLLQAEAAASSVSVATCVGGLMRALQNSEVE